MKENQLHTLISLHEEEEIRLQQLIDDCVKESEFLMAHYHNKALIRLRVKLRKLRVLDDEHYDEKMYLARQIEWLQKELGTAVHEAMKEHYRAELSTKKNALETLNQAPPEVHNLGPDNLLDDALKGLLEGNLKHLRLMLKKSHNLFLKFSYAKKTIKITLPYLRLHISSGLVAEYELETFQNIGFDLNENSSQLVWSCVGDKPIILSNTQIVLSKIVFEIFPFKELRNESYIMFTEKRVR